MTTIPVGTPSVTTRLNVFCADIGSVVGGNFGWFGSRDDGTTCEGTAIGDLASAIAGQMNGGGKVALGFEAPMFVPLRSDPSLLTKRRIGETSPNWIGGPGSAVLATGLAQVPWVLRALKSELTIAGTATLNWDEFESGMANLFLWEAFVSGNAKGQSHIHDARIAVMKFQDALPNPTKQNAITEDNVTCLLGVALLRTGWSADIQLLAQSCVVIKA